MHPIIEAHRDELRALATRYGIRSMRIFGSMARGEADENSDVDLLVEPEPGISGFALGELLMDAQDLLGRRVDIVTLDALHPMLRDQVLRDAQPL